MSPVPGLVGEVSVEVVVVTGGTVEAVNVIGKGTV